MVRRYTCAMLLWLGVSVVCAAEEPRDDTRRIEVTGTAVTQVAPDVVVWSVSTTDESISLGEAKANSDKKVEAIIALVNGLGVAPEDVQTGYVTVNRQYEQNEKGQSTTFKGYAVRRGVTVKQRDLARFDEYLAKLISAADIEVSFRLDSSRTEEIRWDTRLRATKLARDKAEAMAEAAGAQIGRVLILSEPPAREVSPWSNGSIADRNLPVDRSSGTFAPGSIEVRVTVNATYELIQPIS